MKDSILGRKINIYEDPITKEKLEGEAIILQLINENDSFVECQVQFANGDILHRLIYKKDLDKF